MKINNIVIVGGGSSGWMTAAFLSKTFPDKNFFVIESPDIPIVGVGESTLADITFFRDYLEIDEKEFMRETNASYKMSIKFTDFYDTDSGSFHYPFRTPFLGHTKNGLHDWMELKAYCPDLPVQDFVRSYFPHSFLFENNKYDTNKYGEFENFNPKTDVAYHFDSALFGQWLKNKYCIPRGVKLIATNVIDAKINDEGIEYLICDNKEKISADLFIDCTGFKSLLINQYMKQKFISYEDMLPNNRAWATQIPYKDKEKELEPFTNCTAIENGWCWNIPLWSRLGSGYVYSDKFVDPESAKKEFKKYLKSDKMVVKRNEKEVEELEFKDIRFKIGIHEKTWVKNVVAIGLSAGFIEPLESNGLFTTQWFVTKLAKSLLRGEVNQWDRDVYNTATRGIYNNFAEFVALHYALSIRNDSEYWKNIKNKMFYPEMTDLEPTTSVGFFDLQNRKMFDGNYNPQAGISYVSIGMNYPVYDRVDQAMFFHNEIDEKYIKSIINNFEKNKVKWENAASKKPFLSEYLKKYLHDD
jgi:tryptophan halogenase